MVGRLVVIGGSEAKEPERNRAILQYVAAAARMRLVVMTVASQLPQDTWSEYHALFADLGVRDVVHLDVRSREDAYDARRAELLVDGAVCFLTGGDQLRLTSQLGSTPVGKRLRELHDGGGVVCGTSAGAAALSDTMVTGGEGDTSGSLSSLTMAPGLGLLHHAVIDSHFAERGRIGRLLTAVAQNPENHGIGIDEDTAIVVATEGDSCTFRVLGTGAVYVLDGARIRHSNVGDPRVDGVAVCDVILHCLREGDGYDLSQRAPLPAHRNEREAAERA